jgi:hypothetical protein
MKHTLLAAMLVLASGSVPVSAAITIADLFSTGVDAGGALLADGAADPHYDMIANPSGPGTTAYAWANPPGQLQTVYDTYPNSWVLGTAASQWISVTPTAGVQFSPGYDGLYIYRTTFTLPSAWASVNIAGTWATDNGSEIYLNGTYTGVFKGPSSYSSLDAFSLPGGSSFQPGVNVLEFHVTNDPYETNFNPTGLQVLFTAASYVAVPEPVSLVVWTILGLTVGGATWWRRRTAAS